LISRFVVTPLSLKRAGMRDLNEGQKISYDVVMDKRGRRSSADNLKPADGTLATLSRLRLIETTRPARS
jgi:hypothetical protein